MAVTAHTVGTQAATVGTEHFLASPNAAGTYQLVVDTNAMVAGDILELRVYQMVLTSGTARVNGPPQTYFGVQTEDQIKTSIPVSTELTDTNALRFSLKQTAGAAGRSFPFKVLKFA